MATTPMIAPDGSIADVPHESVQQAVRAGAKIAFDMVSPDGRERAAVPLESMHAAIAAGAQLAPSSAGAYAAASVPRPADPMQHVTGYDLIGPVGDSFSNRVGNRIGQNLNAVADMPAEAQREINQAVTHPAQSYSQAAANVVTNTADAVYGSIRNTLTSWHKDPANLVGDVIGGYVTGEAMGAASAAEPKPVVRPAATVAPAASGAASNAVQQVLLNLAKREIPVLGRVYRAYDAVRAVAGAMHPQTTVPVLDGLNDIAQNVLQRIQQAKAAGLSDTSTAAAAPQANTLSSLGTPKLVRSFKDVQEDAQIQDAMSADLESQGAAVQAQQAREFAARNSMDVPKWQRVVNQKVQQLLDAAEAKQTSSTQVKPYKAKAAAAGAGSDDLTDILKASLDLARKKKSLK